MLTTRPIFSYWAKSSTAPPPAPLILTTYRVRQDNLYTFFKNCCHFRYINTTETCNTVLKRKFCGLYGDIFKNCEKCFYDSILSFSWQVAEMANLLGIGKFEVKNSFTIQYLNKNKLIVVV